MTNDVSDQAFSLVCDVFVDASVLHTAMNVSLVEYRCYMASSFAAMREQNFSLVAIDNKTNKMVGCLLACD